METKEPSPLRRRDDGDKRSSFKDRMRANASPSAVDAVRRSPVQVSPVPTGRPRNSPQRERLLSLSPHRFHKGDSLHDGGEGGSRSRSREKLSRTQLPTAAKSKKTAVPCPRRVVVTTSESLSVTPSVALLLNSDGAGVERITVIDENVELLRYHNTPTVDSDDGQCGCTLEQITRDTRGLNYGGYSAEKLGDSCLYCNRQPSRFLCVHCLKSLCPSHVTAHYEASKECSLYINVADISTSLDRIYWCEPCRRFTWAFTESHAALVDQLGYTRETYRSTPIREMDALAVRVGGEPSLTALSTSAQGWRSTQEDTEAMFEVMLPALDVSPSQVMTVFCVFDGHGGDYVAKSAAQQIAEVVRTTMQETSSQGHSLDSYCTVIFEAAFGALDYRIRMSPEGARGDLDLMGCTVCAVCIPRDCRNVVCVNLGDSGAALFHADCGSMRMLTRPHRVDDLEESSRVQRAGLAVENGRIEGLLGVPRALGDYQLKDFALPIPLQAVSSAPDVITVPLPDGPWGIVIACDGVWDTLSIEATTAALCRRLDNIAGLPSFIPVRMFSRVSSLIQACIAPSLTDDGTGIDNVSVLYVEKNTL